MKLEELQALFADGMIGSVDAKHDGILFTIVREHEDTYCFMQKVNNKWRPIMSGTLKMVYIFLQQSAYKNCVFKKKEEQ